MLSVGLRPFRLAAVEVLRILGERCELTFLRGALEELLAALELVPQLLLCFGELLKRLARRLGIESRERVLQLAQPLLELRRERALQQLLDFAKPALERGVVDARRLRGPRDLVHRLRELLYALRHRRLVARDFFRPLRGLKRHRAPRIVAPVRPPARPSIGIPRPLLRQVPRAIAQLALRRGD